MTSQRKILSQSPDADRRKVDNGIPIPDLVIPPVIQQVRDTHTWHMDPRNPEGTYPERLRKRNSWIRDIFKHLEQQRADGYQKHRAAYHTPVRCKCHDERGGKTCGGNYNFGTDYEVLEPVNGAGEITSYGRKADEPSVIVWTIRAGRGKTTDGEVWGSAKLSASAAQRRVQEDLQRVRAILADEKLPDDLVPDPA